MWLQVISIAVGIWLMMSPVVLPSNGQGAGVARIAGALAIWLGALALRDVTRPVRGLNALTGLFLVIAPWLVSNTHPLVLSSSWQAGRSSSSPCHVATASSRWAADGGPSYIQNYWITFPQTERRAASISSAGRRLSPAPSFTRS